MRIDVRKFLLVGVERNRKEFFSQAQEKGIIEFIESKGNNPLQDLPEELHDLMQAVKILRGLPTVTQLEIDDYSKSNQIAQQIIALKKRLQDLEEERRVLRQEVARVAVFGDFSLEKIRQLERESHRVVQFFVAKSHAQVEAAEYDEVILVGSEHGLDYYITINEERKDYEGMLEMLIEQPVGVLRNRQQKVDVEIRQVEQELRTYANRSSYLHEALRDRLNSYHLDTAQNTVNHVMGERLFAAEGWVAEHKHDELLELTQEMNVHCEEVAIEAEDRIPTYLENEGFNKIGEDLVHIYDTPSITDKDPSPWVLWSFALFFAIILGDGGYGLIFLALALSLKMKFPNARGLGKRIIRLTTILSCSCIAWGVLTHSFFGLDFAIDSGIRKASGLQWLVEKKADYHLAARDAVYDEWVERFPSLAQAKSGYEFLQNAITTRNGKTVYTMLSKFSDHIMLELALLIGVVHISLSLLRSLARSWAGIGWVAFLVGGYLYVPEYLHCTSMAQFLGGLDREVGAQVGLELLGGGIGSAVVLALIQFRLGGIGEIINIIQVFADVLSYLRLYALGLAGSMMSSTFNDIGGSIGIVAGVLVILAGHAVNIVLSIMGGVIHGLRLNFLEWYHYCFDGGGRMLRPLKRIKVRQTC